MILAIWYWLFLVFGIVFGGISTDRTNRWWFGPVLAYTILFVIIGLKVFGSPVTR